MNKLKPNVCIYHRQKCTVAERAQCTATSEIMQIEKAPVNQENIFINLTAGAANAHNTTK